MEHARAPCPLPRPHPPVQVRKEPRARVLVVEDCRPLADLVADGFADQGISTDVAYEGAEAAGNLGVNSYDVVVLDRSLPGVPGDALSQMNSSSSERATVLMLSGTAPPQKGRAASAWGLTTTW